MAMLSLNRGSSRTRRLVLIYCLSGPLPTVILAGVSGSLGTIDPWALSAFQLVLGWVLLAILRPNTYHRSAWRAASGVLWLTAPLVLMASASLPFFELLGLAGRKRSLDLRSPAVWATLWMASGYFGCFVAAIFSALPSRPGTPPPALETWSGTATPAPIPTWSRAKSCLRFGLVLATLFATAVAAVPAYLGLSFGAALSRSHIDANVPEQAHFDEYLRRDLTAYFTAVDSSVTDVKYDLLRKAPTQVGVGFPKYYAWIAIHSERSGLEQGVVRLAAEDRAKFEVTTFLTSNEVLSRPQRVLDQFPPALNGEILRRARNASR